MDHEKAMSANIDALIKAAGILESKEDQTGRVSKGKVVAVDGDCRGELIDQVATNILSNNQGDFLYHRIYQRKKRGMNFSIPVNASPRSRPQSSATKSNTSTDSARSSDGGNQVSVREILQNEQPAAMSSTQLQSTVVAPIFPTKVTPTVNSYLTKCLEEDVSTDPEELVVKCPENLLVDIGRSVHSKMERRRRVQLKTEFIDLKSTFPEELTEVRMPSTSIMNVALRYVHVLQKHQNMLLQTRSQLMEDCKQKAVRLSQLHHIKNSGKAESDKPRLAIETYTRSAGDATAEMSFKRFMELIESKATNDKPAVTAQVKAEPSKSVINSIVLKVEDVLPKKPSITAAADPLKRLATTQELLVSATCDRTGETTVSTVQSSADKSVDATKVKLKHMLVGRSEPTLAQQLRPAVKIIGRGVTSSKLVGKVLIKASDGALPSIAPGSSATEKISRDVNLDREVLGEKLRMKIQRNKEQEVTDLIKKSAEDEMKLRSERSQSVDRTFVANQLKDKLKRRQEMVDDECVKKRRRATINQGLLLKIIRNKTNALEREDEGDDCPSASVALASTL